MPISDKVSKMYQRFYAQKGILTGAPALTIDVNAIGGAEFPVDKALTEMAAVASYLMGVADMRKIPFERAVQIVQDAYAEQKFWQDLLFDYLGMTLDWEEADLKKEGAEIQKQISNGIEELENHERKVEAIVRHFSEKIAAEKFHVDGKRLIQNYLKMMSRDSKEAWNVLITNPAYFSPIVTRDEAGERVLTPDQAIEENTRLAGFLKNVKG